MRPSSWTLPRQNRFPSPSRSWRRHRSVNVTAPETNGDSMTANEQPSRLSVSDAIAGRRSVRRFLDEPVRLGVVRDVLSKATRAPSGSNSQPWIVHVVAGESRRRVSAAVQAALEEELIKQPYYPYFPVDVGEPFASRRSEFGLGLTALDGFDRRDLEGLRNALRWNYRFFGAPIGLFFCLDRNLLHGSWLDIGMFMQNVMLLARSHGLESCAQVSWANYGGVVQRELSIPLDHVIVAGMSLGYADEAAAPNRLRTERAPVDEFATFHE
jgi:nitroreductase